MHRVFVIGFVWPEPGSSAAGVRMLQLLEKFIENKWDVTFGSAASKSDFSKDLESIGVKTVEIQLNNTSFDILIKGLNPTIVLFDRFMVEEQYGWRVSEHCPNALKVLDTEDLHCLRKGREEAFKNAIPFRQSFLNNEIALRELASIYRCDMSLMISDFEIELLKTVFSVSESLLCYLPMWVPNKQLVELSSLPSFDEREDIVFIGNFLHNPNVDAVIYLKKVIWPLISKKLPAVKLHIYGAYSSQKVLQLHNLNERFLVHGRAVSVEEVMRKAKICVAPLRFGAGVKGKLLDAMRLGTPSVTTHIGAEAMSVEGVLGGAIFDDPEEFSNAAVTLYLNKTLWLRAQSEGISVLNKRFLEPEAAFFNLFTKLHDSLDLHREKNVVGRLLQYHTLQGTKYMSKWIEEKNKVHDQNKFKSE